MGHHDKLGHRVAFEDVGVYANIDVFSAGASAGALADGEVKPLSGASSVL